MAARALGVEPLRVLMRCGGREPCFFERFHAHLRPLEGVYLVSQDLDARTGSKMVCDDPERYVGERLAFCNHLFLVRMCKG